MNDDGHHHEDDACFHPCCPGGEADMATAESIRALSSRLRSWAQESLVNHQIGSATITMALDAAQAIEDLLARLERTGQPASPEEP